MAIGKGIGVIAACMLLAAIFAPDVDAGAVNAVAVVLPGPATLVLLSTGLLGLGGAVRRRIWRD